MYSDIIPENHPVTRNNIPCIYKDIFDLKRVPMNMQTLCRKAFILSMGTIGKTSLLYISIYFSGAMEEFCTEKEQQMFLATSAPSLTLLVCRYKP